MENSQQSQMKNNQDLKDFKGQTIKKQWVKPTVTEISRFVILGGALGTSKLELSYPSYSGTS